MPRALSENDEALLSDIAAVMRSLIDAETAPLRLRITALEVLADAAAIQKAARPRVRVPAGRQVAT